MASFHAPAWAWVATIAGVAILLALDLLASYRRTRPPSLVAAAGWTLVSIVLAVGFGAVLAITSGGTPSGQFFAGWLTEYSLSLDNLLIFVILIGRSTVPQQLHDRAVLAGIVLALLLRGVVIGLGAAALRRFGWVEYLFGAFLIYTAAQVARHRPTGRLDATAPAADDAVLTPPSAGRARSGAMTPSAVGPSHAVSPANISQLATRLTARRHITPLLVLIIALGATDVVFALDSIPAVFGLTRDPFLVVSANLFALLGLRHLYFLAAGLLKHLVYLPAGLAVILFFIGVKLISEALRESGVTRLGPVPIPRVSAWLSLMIIACVLTVTTVASMTATRRKPLQPGPAARSGDSPPGPGHPPC